MKKKEVKSKEKLIQLEEQYVAFLHKKLMSLNYVKNSTKEEYNKEKKKYDKAKLKLKFLKES